MIWNIITGLLGVAGSAVENWQKRQTIRAESAVRLEEAKLNAEIARTQKLVDAEVAWDQAAVEQMEHSWKDEWFTLLLSVPLILAFMGEGGRRWVAEGFDALATMPSWYQMAVGVAIAASFGYRKLVDFMAKWRGQ